MAQAGISSTLNPTADAINWINGLAMVGAVRSPNLVIYGRCWVHIQQTNIYRFLTMMYILHLVMAEPKYGPILSIVAIDILAYVDEDTGAF